MMKHAVWLLVALAFTACAPDGPVWETADEETRTTLAEGDVESVSLTHIDGSSLAYFRIELHASGDVTKSDGRGTGSERNGNSVATMSSSQWTRVCRALGSVPFTAVDVGEPSPAWTSLSVVMKDRATYDLSGVSAEEGEVRRVIDELDAELAWSVPLSDQRPLDEEIAAVRFIESQDDDTTSHYELRLERDGTITKDDQRAEAEHERGEFVGKLWRREGQAILAFIEGSSIFAQSASYSNGSYHGVNRTLEIEYDGGTTIRVSSTTITDHPELFVAIQAIKGLDAEVEWTPR